MTTQKTKVRTANNTTAVIGTHLTLTRCENDVENKRVFGFAVTDEGQEVYVPASVVRKYEMTPADADAQAGFTAPLRPNPRVIDDATVARSIVTNPVKWDGEPVLETDLIRLAEATDEMVLQAVEEIRNAMGKIGNFEINDAVHLLGETADKLEAYRAYIDEVVPCDGD